MPLKADKLRPTDTEAVARVLLPYLEGSEFATLQEKDASFSLSGVGRFRANVYRQRGTFGSVLRIIPSQTPSIAELGLPSVLGKIADEERGLILVTGVTGSGKSTTLAAMLDRINQTRMGHILTIEDPIEFLHPHKKCSVSQREVGPDTVNFITGLRSALRQDPDVIMVGEMRDKESIDIALKASETGHLVLSTVHTTDTEKTLGRLLSVFESEVQPIVRRRLAENLRAVVSQRLVPRADGSGLIPAVEILRVTGTVRDLLENPEQELRILDIVERSRDPYGMQSFDQHLRELMAAGSITLAAALQNATSPLDFERSLNFERG